MSGSLSVLAATATSESMIVTVGVGLGNGYSSSGGFGSISPGTYRTKSILTARSTGGVDLQITIDDTSTLPQSFFTRIVIEDGTGAIRSYLSANATFVGGGVGGDDWNFGNGSSPVFAAGDSGEQHRITFYL